MSFRLQSFSKFISGKENIRSLSGPGGNWQVWLTFRNAIQTSLCQGRNLFSHQGLCPLLLALTSVHIHTASDTCSSSCPRVHITQFHVFLLLRISSNTPSTSISVTVCTIALLQLHAQARMCSCLHLFICVHTSCNLSLQGCCQPQTPAVPRMT